MQLAEVRRAFDERKNAAVELRSLIDLANTEKRELTAEEQATEARLNTALDELQERVDAGLAALASEKRTSEQAEILARHEAAAAKHEQRGQPAGTRGDADKIMALYRNESRGEDFNAPAGFKQGLSTRDLSVFDPAGTPTPAAGGDLVPVTLFSELYQHLEEDVTIMRELARPLVTTSGEKIELPKVTSYSSATWIGEGAAIPESDPSFEKVAIEAHKLAKLSQITHELEEDNIVGVVSFLAQDGARALGRALGTSLIVGTDTGQPNGAVNTANPKNVTAAVATAVTFEELMDLQRAIVSGYRSGAAFIVKDTSVLALRKIKNTNDEFVWRDGVRLGDPDVLLGNRVYTDDSMGEIASTETSVLYGNFSRGYIFRTVGSIRVEVSRDFAFANDLNTWRFIGRFDGEILDDTAIAKLTHPV